MAVDNYPELTEALGAIAGRVGHISRNREFYDGVQARVYSSDAWLEEMDGALIDQPRDNMVPLVVDTVVSRMDLKGVVAREDEPVSNDGAEQALSILKRNRGDVLMPDTHTEVGKCSRAYVILGVNTRGKSVFHPHYAETCYVSYDPEVRGARAWAAQVWPVGKNYRANLYFPDRIERFITTHESWSADLMPKESGDFREYGDDDRDALLLNPLGFVPVYEFEVPKADVDPLISLQPALDLAFANLTITAHKAGFPQKYITGAFFNNATQTDSPAYLGSSTEPDELPENAADPDTDDPALDGSPSRTWILANEAAKVGQLAAAPLEGNLKLLDNIRSAILRSGSIPPHLALMLLGDFPSGKALITAEAQFASKVKGRTTRLGNTWEDMLADAVVAENSHDDQGFFTSLAERPELETVWDEPYTVAGMDQTERVAYLIELGVPMSEILVTEFGYSQERADELAELKRGYDELKAQASRFALEAGVVPDEEDDAEAA